MSSAAPVAAADTGPVWFDHALAGVGLTGPAARLAGLLDRGFLTEAGWDPASRVLSLPAAHPLLGRALCRVGGCMTTVHGGTGGVCSRCLSRLRGQGAEHGADRRPSRAATAAVPPGGVRRCGLFNGDPGRAARVWLEVAARSR